MTPANPLSSPRMRDPLGCSSPTTASRAIRSTASAERDHAADAVLALHQPEAVVDVVERDPVRDERVDVELAVEIQLHELGHLIASLDAAERGSAYTAPLDQKDGA